MKEPRKVICYVVASIHSAVRTQRRLASQGDCAIATHRNTHGYSPSCRVTWSRPASSAKHGTYRSTLICRNLLYRDFPVRPQIPLDRLLLESDCPDGLPATAA